MVQTEYIQIRVGKGMKIFMALGIYAMTNFIASNFPVYLLIER